ncbi:MULTISPECIES: type IV secretory system conjugative DNA transfer family protein [Streptomyces]|uniref:Type IV secretory system conjugative DNA transfer family protein n=2 Tax=Streptomyces TaxID=1883 RepID=A0ABU4KDL3_9ACTN|nr:type IV secretory system conjugative DNA transfer family protein [Streptomyces roseolus]MDX2295858.1 type IV secretory system conjugative DNA transfer family protein [Streptomyces roseolus]
MTEARQRQGGVSDGFLIGLFALLLGASLLVWSATGLAGLLAHGAWPDGVELTRTPPALRALATAPTDLAAAWPDTPPDQLSGYGLFWGLVIGQAMVLAVLAVFLLGTFARWRAVRAQRRAGAYAPPAGPAPEPGPVPLQKPLQNTPAPAPAPEPQIPPQTAQEQTQRQPRRQPEPPAPVPAAAPEPGAVYGPPETRRPLAVQAVGDAEGPVLVVTSDPTVWADTKDVRGKLGPVLVYDPGHLCDTPARLHWSPVEECADPDAAQARAAALLAPVRPHARLDAATADTAETLLRCWLHAAAVDGRPFRQVHRWAQGTDAHEPVRILRGHPKAASGLAGLLEAALTAHPETRRLAQELTARAFSAFSSVHIREACTPNRTDSLALASFLAEGGTLYVVGEPIEDPRTHPGAMPLLTALASHVVEHGRRMAARSSDGRLDPPLTLVLDDVAAVAPLPQLPALLTDGPNRGLPTLALMRSPEQARTRWPERSLR